MTNVKLIAGDYSFEARLEEGLAPKACDAFMQHLPFKSRAIHVRWSGEGVWMPLGDLDFGVGFENHICYPTPGQVIIYPDDVRETEILLSYGYVNWILNEQKPHNTQVLRWCSFNVVRYSSCSRTSAK